MLRLFKGKPLHTLVGLQWARPKQLSAGYLRHQSSDSDPVSILYKSIAGRYRPVGYPDGPISARYRFIKNAGWGYRMGQSFTQIRIRINVARATDERS